MSVKIFSLHLNLECWIKIMVNVMDICAVKPANNGHSRGNRKRGHY